MFSIDQNVKPIFRLCEDLIEHDEISIPLRFHNKGLLQNLESAKIIKQKKLINLWNSHHFTDGMVYVQLNHPQYKEDILVWAHPQPCSSDSMTCRWPEESRGIVENVEILNIILPMGFRCFSFPPN